MSYSLGFFFPFSKTGNNVSIRDLVNSIPCSTGFTISSGHRICEEIEVIFVEKQKEEIFTNEKPMLACLLEHS